MTNSDKFIQVFNGMLPSELWVMSKEDLWKWLNAEYEESERSMTFKVIDTKTGKEPTQRVIYNIAKKGGLMTMDIDQFFVGEDGSLVLADECGNMTYCDINRFRIETQESEEE